MKMFLFKYRSLAIIGILLLAASADADDKINRARKPLLVLTGSYSQFNEAAFHRISTAKQLEQIWRKHAENSEKMLAPEVDWDHCFIVAIFRGYSFNSRGIRIDSVVESDDKITLRFDDLSYQTAGPDGGANSVTPYAFILLPNTKKTLVLEDNVQIYTGQPAKWKEVARLKAGD